LKLDRLLKFIYRTAQAKTATRWHGPRSGFPSGKLVWASLWFRHSGVGSNLSSGDRTRQWPQLKAGGIPLWDSQVSKEEMLSSSREGLPGTPRSCQSITQLRFLMGD